MDLIALALAKKYILGVLEGVELIQGKDCQIQSIDEITGGHRITFAYYGEPDEDDESGEERVLKTKTLDVMNGVNIESVEKTSTSGKTDTYTITLSDDSTSTFTVKNADELVVTEEADTEYNYRVGFKVGDGDKVVTPNMKGSMFFEGTAITSTAESGTTVVIANSKKGDLYLNTETKNLYKRTDFNPSTESTVNNHWVMIATLRGNDGLNAYRTWLTIEGNEGKTIQQWVEETSGSAYEIQKVWGKPNIQDNSTDMNVWYFYKTGKPLGDKFVTRQFAARLADVSTLTAGSKYSLKCVEGEDTTWVAFTIPSGLEPLEDGWKYIFSITLNHTDNVVIGTYKVDGETNELRVFDFVATDNASTSACQEGYTEITASKNTWSDDSWKWLSSPTDFSLLEEGNKYAFWTGVGYLTYDIEFLPTPTTNSQLVAMWDEHNLTGSMWGYVSSEDKYYLEYPAFLPIVMTTTIPEGAIDTSEWVTFEQMGRWNQTMYVQPSSEAQISEITIITGESYAGLMTQFAFDDVIGTDSLHTTNQTVKGAINELNDILRNDVVDTFDTNANNAIGAINELASVKLDKKFTAADEGKYLKVIKIESGADTTYEARAVEMTGLLDLIYPIGAICFGTHPTIGTWEVYNFGGYVCSDTSLASGTTMIEHLPNITGAITGNGRNLLYGSGQATGVFAYVGASGKWHEQSGNSGGGNFNFDASRSSNVYGSANNHYDVEVKGKNVTAYIRTA